MIDATDTIDRARRLLEEPALASGGPIAALSAALLAAVAAVTMAGVVVLGPTLAIDAPTPIAWTDR